MTELTFTLDDRPVALAVDDGETLLTVLRERLGVRSVKDGCAPQGQCGCCTVLVDGSPRVSCVTPATRVQGRAVATVATAPGAERIATALCATGGTQCGFCTPGIVTRLAATAPTNRAAFDKALAAHLCRCTGWQTIREAVLDDVVIDDARDRARADERARLEGGTPQRVTTEVALGAAVFADDTAPSDALVAVPKPPGSEVESVLAAGVDWVLGATLTEARQRAAKTQGRRTTAPATPPLSVPNGGDGVVLATSWVEPAYLEPDASWCVPGGDPASPLANGGAFGAKLDSVAPIAARELADLHDRTVRVVFAREDVVRLGPKRPPIAARATWNGTAVEIEGRVALAADSIETWNAAQPRFPFALEVREQWTAAVVPGPPTSLALRAAGMAERAALVYGALHAADVSMPAVAPAAMGLEGVIVGSAQGAWAGVAVEADGGVVKNIEVDVTSGDVLDVAVLRSYVIGAVHAALGWVTSESIAVDDDGMVHDLTIRSFGIVRPNAMPPVTVRVVEASGPPVGGTADAAFAATAAAVWAALDFPACFPSGPHARGKLAP